MSQFLVRHGPYYYSIDTTIRSSATRTLIPTTMAPIMGIWFNTSIRTLYDVPDKRTRGVTNRHFIYKVISEKKGLEREKIRIDYGFMPIFRVRRQVAVCSAKLSSTNTMFGSRFTFSLGRYD